jgi:endonuclease YncB( thermonuclease family)
MAARYANDLSKRRLLQFSAVILILWMAAGSALGFNGEIIQVDDGDTMVALVDGERQSIRLYGIDAPEPGQHGSNAALRYLRSIALAHPVEVEIVETDVFGRAVAVVRRVEKESSINAAIVAHGYAWVNPKSCRLDVCSAWNDLQRQAEKYQLGIWSGFDLVPPWEYRQQQTR